MSTSPRSYVAKLTSSLGLTPLRPGFAFISHDPRFRVLLPRRESNQAR